MSSSGKNALSCYPASSKICCRDTKLQCILYHTACTVAWEHSELWNWTSLLDVRLTLTEQTSSSSRCILPHSKPIFRARADTFFSQTCFLTVEHFDPQPQTMGLITTRYALLPWSKTGPHPRMWPSPAKQVATADEEPIQHSRRNSELNSALYCHKVPPVCDAVFMFRTCRHRFKRLPHIPEIPITTRCHRGRGIFIAKTILCRLSSSMVPRLLGWQDCGWFCNWLCK